MTVTCLRVHDLVSGEVDPGGAHVVLVDRLWPRGVSKERAALDDWLKDVAPSTDLRRWFHHEQAHFQVFALKYRDELAHIPAAQAAIQKLLDMAKKGRVTLLYAARDPDINHAVVLRDYLQQYLPL